MTVVVGLGMLYTKWPLSRERTSPDEVWHQGVCHVPSPSACELLLRLRGGRGWRIILSSPFSRSLTARLLHGLGPAAVGLEVAVCPAAWGNETVWWRHDNLMLGELRQRRCANDRLLVLDGGPPSGTNLSENRIPGLGARIGQVAGLIRHLEGLRRQRGDLRKVDRTYRWEEHDTTLASSLRKMATDKAATLPNSLRASRSGESLLCLDMDETIVHVFPVDRPDYARQHRDFEVDLMTTVGRVRCGVCIRPGLHDFLEGARRLFDRVFIYTASASDNAQAVLDGVFKSGRLKSLAPDGIISGRQALRIYNSDEESKSVLLLEQLGFERGRIVIVDDRPSVYHLSRHNVCPLPPFYGDFADRELAVLLRGLRLAARRRDVPRALLRWSKSLRRE